MIDYTPKTPLEAAVLESGRFEFAIDSAGREVLSIGHRRLPKVVLPRKAEGLHELIEALSADGGESFSVTEGDPWLISQEEPDRNTTTIAAEEYVVMGLRPMTLDHRPIRVAAGRGVVRLFLLPWYLPAKTLDFGEGSHYMVSATRGVLGSWALSDDARLGVVIGVPEVWIGILERHCSPGAQLVFRCDVPVPWVGDAGLSNAVPTTVGVFEISTDVSKAPYQPNDQSAELNEQQWNTPFETTAAVADTSADNPLDNALDNVLDTPSDGTGTWIAKLPVVMTEGNVVKPVEVPIDIDVVSIPDGPWEIEFGGDPDDFSNLT